MDENILRFKYKMSISKHIGIIEAQNVSVINYNHSLSNDVTAIQNAVEIHDATNLKAGGGNFSGNKNGQQDPSGQKRWIITQEKRM